MRWLYLLHTSIEVFSRNHGDMASLRHGRAILAVLTECVLRPFVLIVSWGKKKDSGKRNVALVEP